MVYGAVGADQGLVSPCSTTQSGRPAPRPAYAVLDCSATVAALPVPLPHWQDQVVPYVHTGRAPALGLVSGGRTLT